MPKKGIHPLQRVLRIVNTKGASVTAYSVAQPAGGLAFLQHDSTTHPAWTGRKKEATNTGQVAKFRQRFGLVRLVPRHRFRLLTRCARPAGERAQQGAAARRRRAVMRALASGEAARLRLEAATARRGGGLARERRLLDLRRSKDFQARLARASAPGALGAEELVDALWAAAAVGGSSPPLPALAAALAPTLAARGAPLSPRLRADACWALAEARWSGRAALRALAQPPPSRRARPREAAATLWAEAMLRGEDDGGGAAGESAAALGCAEEGADWGLRPAALALWALAADEAQDSPSYHRLWRGLERARPEDADEAALSQLHQTSLSLPPSLPPLPPSLAAAAAAAWARREALSPAHSALQQSVGNAFASLGLAPRAEVQAAGYCVDWELRSDGARRRVLVEVDGPGHFAAGGDWAGAGAGRALLGNTRLKRRQLRAAGEALLAVPHWEWSARGGPRARAAWLAERLEEAWSAPELHLHL